MIRSWNALRNQPGVALAPQLPTQSQQGVNPIITYISLGLATSQGLPADPPRPLYVHLYPTVVLWNPLNVPIAAADYELCFAPRFSGGGTAFTFAGDASPSTGFDVNNVRVIPPPFPAATTWYRFKVKASRIEPGESLIFTLPDPDDADAGPPSYQAGDNVLKAGFNPDNSIYVSGDTALTTAQRSAVITWSSTNSGGSIVAVLREIGHPPLTTESYQLLPGAYSSAQLMGYGAAGPSLPSPQNNPEAITARFSFYAEARRSASNQTSRWVASLNPRASLITRLGMEGGAHGLFFSAVQANPTVSFPSAPRASARESISGSAADTLVLAEFLPEGLPIMSLAQLQQVNFSLLHTGPTYAVGNSLASYHVPLTETSFTDSAPISGHPVSATYDLSYLLNEALFDRYFFSTVPDGVTTDDWENSDYHLPNGRQQFLHGNIPSVLDEIRGRAAFNSVASHLMINGGFNINSTSEQAWRAQLASLNGVKYTPQTGQTSSTALAYPFSRHARPVGLPNETWSGLRELTEAQIDRLAFNIVREIKARGPFRSMADFVNRRLQSVDTTAGLDGGAGFKGALQAAIDRMDYETDADGGPPIARINDDFSNPALLVNGATVRPQSITGISDPNHYLLLGGTGTSRTYQSRAAGAPGYLTQADILSSIGAALTARSDTFVVRAYGDVRNPATGTTEGRAWCEAVVQRLPAFLESGATAAWETPSSGSTNALMGRRFQVVSFRWLSPQDI